MANIGAAVPTSFVYFCCVCDAGNAQGFFLLKSKNCSSVEKNKSNLINLTALICFKYSNQFLHWTTVEMEREMSVFLGQTNESGVRDNVVVKL